MGVLEEAQGINDTWKARVEATLDDHRDQLASYEEKFNRGNARFEEGERRMTHLEEKLDANNAMTARVEKNTNDLLAIFAAFDGFVKVNRWIGGLLKWLAAIVIATGVLIYVWKTGHIPGPKP